MQNYIYTADSGREYLAVEPIAVTEFSRLFFAVSLNEPGEPERVLKISLPSREKAFEDELDAFLLIAKNYGPEGHPGVVRLFDKSRKDSFLVMEYIPGFNLFQVNNASGEFNLLEAMSLTMSLSRTFSDLHSMGIVHKDLKLENILLRPREEDQNLSPDYVPGKFDIENAKICDLGISMINGTSRYHKTITKGRFLGSPGYSPPEVCSGRTPGDSSCDVWALGISLYYLLSGDGPFPGVLSEQYATCIDVVHRINPPLINRNLHGFQSLIYEMRNYAPWKRPTMREIHGKTSLLYEKLKK